MAAIIAGDRYKMPFAGEDGNSSNWNGYYKMPAAGSIGDTVDLFEVPAGARIDEYGFTWAGQSGTTATVAIGWKYKDGSAGGSASALRTATAVGAAAGSVSAGLLPIYFEKPAIIYVTNGVAAFASGAELYVKAEGEFVGTK